MESIRRDGMYTQNESSVLGECEGVPQADMVLLNEKSTRKLLNMCVNFCLQSVYCRRNYRRRARFVCGLRFKAIIFSRFVAFDYRNLIKF